MPFSPRSMATRRILITRPASQGVKLCERLSTAGFVVTHVPVMAVEGLFADGEKQQIADCFAGINDYDAVIMVSLNAAEQALHWFAKYPVRAGMPYYSVGKTTARYCEEHGIKVTHPAQRMDSEGLLALPDMQLSQVSGKRFLILRGVGGREKLADTLRERGAEVQSCALYRRFAPQENAAALSQYWPNCDLLQVNSGESLDNLLTLLGGAETVAPALYDKTLLVPGGRVEELARTRGFQHIIVADNATDDATFNQIVEWAQT